MTFGPLGMALVHLLLAFALAHGLAALALHATTGPFLRLLRRASPRVRVRALLGFALAPALAGGGAAFTALIGFLRHEPPRAAEQVGVPGLVALAIALCLLAVGPLEGVGALAASRRLARRWQRDARPLRHGGVDALVIDRGGVVAAVGVWRPRIFVARDVAAILTGAELAVVLRHEAAHLGRCHNLLLLLLRALPDWPGRLGVRHRLIPILQEAFDVEADAVAAQGSPDAATDLASALLKISRRLLPATPLPVGSGFFEGAPIAGRVHRLIEPPPGSPRLPVDLVVAVSWAAACAALCQAPVARAAHAILEAIVSA